MVRIRNATGTQFSQCHFTFGSTGGVLIEAGEPGRPAIHTRMIACGFGLGSRPLEDVNITDNRAIKLENVDEFHVWATQLWATDSPGYQKQWVCGVDASKLYINGVRGGASDCIGIESGP